MTRDATTKGLTYEDLSALMKSTAGVSVDSQTLAGEPDTPFTAYGLDSLGVLGIITALENRHGISIGPEAETCKTPHAFLDIVNAALTA